MTASDASAPRSEPTFESLERELKTVTGRLEDPAVPLEERLRLHARAVALHTRLEATLEAARKTTGEDGNEAGPKAKPPPDDGGEPYEAVRDRLAEVANALERDDLPLARVVELHREAERLAARCEAILETAQDQIARTGGDSGNAPPPAASSGSTPDGERRDDVPL